jgi:hypothetical protein
VRSANATTSRTDDVPSTRRTTTTQKVLFRTQIACPDLKDRLGDQIGGSEWEPIKILLQRENSAYSPHSQPRIPTRVCQGHVVTTDLPTLGTNPKQSRS